MFRSRLVLVALLAALLPLPALAAGAEVECTLRFTMHGWSVFYRTASGSGTVQCSDGQTMPVELSARGGGITFGKTEIDDGLGRFSGVYDIREVLGSYVAAEAHAGAVKSTKAQAMTKGPVSLALTGTGRGWDVGFAFGKFEITRRRGAITQPAN